MSTIVYNRNGIPFDIDAIATDLNGKADVDLTNVNDNGTSKGASWAMPSSTYDDLTLGASGTTYTAPANGWFYLNKTAGINNGYITLENNDNNIITTIHVPSSDSVCRAYIPVAKNQIITVYYSATGTTNYFRFAYAVGSESEAQ